jgi:hypothetical protein
VSSPEFKADIHRLVRERRAQGLPVWKSTLRLKDIFHNEAMTFEERRDAIVRQVRASSWFKEYGDFDDLPQFVDELSEAETPGDFDSIWDEIRDIATCDRVWIETR